MVLKQVISYLIQPQGHQNSSWEISQEIKMRIFIKESYFASKWPKLTIFISLIRRAHHTAQCWRELSVQHQPRAPGLGTAFRARWLGWAGAHLRDPPVPLERGEQGLHLHNMIAEK